MILVQFSTKKTGNLKYQSAEYNAPPDYMRAAMRRFGKANRVVYIATRILIFC